MSRRVFRSGESVYLLNGQQCRLKDINDVFMDSGLGKEAFSMISQGRVDEILNSRPEDRRSIFDEAAGVLKYKTRKKKAEHKLFETEDNLDRVLDILKELDSRIEPLQKSAEAAEKHQALSEEMREADVMLLNYDARELRHEILVKAEEAKKIRLDKERFEAETEKSEERSTALKSKLEQVDQELDELQRKLVEVSARLKNGKADDFFHWKNSVIRTNKSNDSVWSSKLLRSENRTDIKTGCGARKMAANLIRI